MTPTSQPTIDQLFAAGAHFGFTKRRRHPSVVPYLYGTKDGNDIIDLEQTSVQLAAAGKVIQDMVTAGKTVMYVGTKDEVARQVRATAGLVGAPYATNRWIGGMLTNFSEVKKRIQRLHELQQEKEGGAWERKYTKKERVMLGRELTKLEFNFGGIQHLTKTPDLLVVVDPRFEEIAIDEAETLNIPVIALAGTDCNLTRVTYPVAINDALQSSVQLALQQFAACHQAGMNAAPAPRSAANATTGRSVTA